MTKFYFNIQGVSSHAPVPDEVGEELPSAEAAWKEATLIAGELFKDVDGKLRPDQGWKLEVTDANQPLFEIKVSSKKLE